MDGSVQPIDLGSKDVQGFGFIEFRGHYALQIRRAPKSVFFDLLCLEVILNEILPINTQ